MRITRMFGQDGGIGLQDMTMEQTFIWHGHEEERVPLCVRNAIEAAATLGSRFFDENAAYAFAEDAKGRPTLLVGAIATVPGTATPMHVPLWNFWRDLLKSAAKSFETLKLAPDVDKADVKRPFLAQMMLLDMLLRENPFHITRSFEGGSDWKNSWHDRRTWTRKRFLEEVAALRSPT